MEQKIREYERFIEQKTSGELGPIERVKVAEYHKEMLANFQHERLVHLLIMLFFVAVSLALIGGFVALTYCFGMRAELIPFYILLGIVIILTIFYVKHYYFLENHIQKLYQYTKKLRLGN